LRIVAALLTVWVAWRWLGFAVGLLRVRRFEGPVRREARRTVIGRGAWNVFLSVVVVYLWAAVTREQPGEAFVGFLAATLMCSLVVGIVAGFMQPEPRTPETLSICSLRPVVEREDQPSAGHESTEEHP
jgi:hypothetical protein